MRIRYQASGLFAAVLAVVLAASQGAARTSCDTIVKLVAVEAQAAAALSGASPETEQQIFARMENMLMGHFPDASNAAAESSFVAAYYSTRMMAVKIYRTQGREDARLYMKSSSFSLLSDTLHGLHEDRNCALTGGRTLVADRPGISPNYEISSGGGQSEDSTQSDSTDPTRVEKVGVGHASPEVLPILPLAIAVVTTSIAAWLFLRRRRKPERRLSCNIVILVSNGLQIKESTLTDISRGGCKIIRNLPVERDDPIKIMWAREWITGRCMWQDDDFCGIMFDTRLTRAQLEMLRTIDRYDEFLRASDLEELGLVEDEKLVIGGSDEPRELGAEMDVEWPHRSWTDASTDTGAEDDEAGSEGADDDDEEDGDEDWDEDWDEDGEIGDETEDAASATGAGAADDGADDADKADTPEAEAPTGGNDADPEAPEEPEPADDPEEVQLSFDDLFGITDDAPPASGTAKDPNADDDSAAHREDAVAG